MARKREDKDRSIDFLTVHHTHKLLYTRTLHEIFTGVHVLKNFFITSHNAYGLLIIDDGLKRLPGLSGRSASHMPATEWVGKYLQFGT